MAKLKLFGSGEKPKDIKEEIVEYDSQETDLFNYTDSDDYSQTAVNLVKRSEGLSSAYAAGKGQELSQRDYDRRLMSEKRQGHLTNMWNSFMNAIDEIDESRYKGKQIPINAEIFELENELSSLENPTKEEVDDITLRIEGLRGELEEIQKDVDTQEEDIKDSPVDKEFTMEQEMLLAEENSNLFDYLMYESPKELGGTASEWGTQLALTGKQIAMSYGKNLAKTAILNALPGEGTVASGVVSAILTGVDMMTTGAALWKMRENETYAEMNDAFEQRYQLLTDRFIKENGIDALTEDAKKEIYLESYKGLEELKQKNMSIMASDALGVLLSATPWTKGAGGVLGAAKGYNRWIRFGSKLIGGLAAAGLEGGEEAVEYGASQDYLAGFFSENPNYIESIFNANVELLDASGYALGLKSHKFEDESEFRNAVRSGLILGGLMGGSSNLAGMGKDFYNYNSIKKNINKSSEKLFDSEELNFKADFFSKTLSKGKTEFVKEVLRDMVNSPSSFKETLNKEDVQYTLDKLTEAEKIYDSVLEKASVGNVKRPERFAKILTKAIIQNDMTREYNSNALSINNEIIDKVFSQAGLTREALEFLSLKGEAALSVKKQAEKEYKESNSRASKSKLDYANSVIEEVNKKQKEFFQNNKDYKPLTFSGTEKVFDILKNNIGFEYQNKFLREEREYMSNKKNFKNLENDIDSFNKTVKEAIKKAKKEEVKENVKNAKNESEVEEIKESAKEEIPKEDSSTGTDWDEIINSAISNNELNAILDQIDESGEMTPELMTSINKKRESIKDNEDIDKSAEDGLSEKEEEAVYPEIKIDEKLKEGEIGEKLSEPLFNLYNDSPVLLDRDLRNISKFGNFEELAPLYDYLEQVDLTGEEVDPNIVSQMITEGYVNNPEFADAIHKYFGSILDSKLNDLKSQFHTSQESDEGNAEEVSKDNTAISQKYKDSYDRSLSPTSSRLFIFQREAYQTANGDYVFSNEDLVDDKLVNTPYEPDYEFTNKGGVKVGDKLKIRVVIPRGPSFNTSKDLIWHKAKLTKDSDGLYNLDSDKINAVVVHTDNEGKERVVGTLTTPLFTQEGNKPTPETISLTKIRQELFESIKEKMKDPSQRGTTHDHPTEIEVKDIFDGRLDITETLNNPKDVMSDGDPLVFGISNESGVIEVPNAENLDLRYSTIDMAGFKPYSMYMLVPSAKGRVLPYRVYKKKIGEIEGHFEENVAPVLDSLTRGMDTKEIVDSVHSVVGVPRKNISISKGKVIISKKSKGEVASTVIELGVDGTELTQENVEFINDTLASIKDFELNSGILNDEISDGGLVETTLKPKSYVHSATITTSFSEVKPIESVPEKEEIKEIIVEEPKEGPSKKAITPKELSQYLIQNINDSNFRRLEEDIYKYTNAKERSSTFDKGDSLKRIQQADENYNHIIARNISNVDINDPDIDGLTKRQKRKSKFISKDGVSIQSIAGNLITGELYEFGFNLDAPYIVGFIANVLKNNNSLKEYAEKNLKTPYNEMQDALSSLSGELGFNVDGRNVDRVIPAILKTIEAKQKGGFLGGNDDSTQGGIEDKPDDGPDDTNPFGSPSDDDTIAPFANELTSYKRERWNEKSEVAWFKRAFGDSMPVNVVKSISEIANTGGYEAWGLFKNAGIYIAEDAGSLTLVHEAGHGLFRLAFNDRERASVLSEMKADTTNFPKPTQEDLNKLEKLHGEKFSKEEIEDLYYEELFNEALVEYIQLEGLNSNTFGARLRRALQTLATIIKRFIKGPESLKLDEYFLLANQGFYKNKVLPKGTYKFSANAFSVPGFNSVERAYAVNMTNNIMFNNIMRDVVGEGTLNDYLKSLKGKDERMKAIDSIYNKTAEYIRAGLANAYNANALTKDQIQFGKILLNGLKPGSTIRTLAIKDLSSIGISIGIAGDFEFTTKNEQGLENDDNILFEHNEETTKGEVYDVEHFTISPFEKASERLKIKLRSYPKREVSGVETRNDYGFIEYESGFDLFNYLLKNTTDSRDVAEMRSKIVENIPYKPSLIQMVNEMDADPSYASELWRTIGQLTRINYLTLRQRGGEFRTFIGNEGRVDSHIMKGISDKLSTLSDADAKKIIAREDFIKKQKARLGENGDKRVARKGLSRTLNDFGVDISPNQIDLNSAGEDSDVRMITALKGLEEVISFAKKSQRTQSDLSKTLAVVKRNTANNLQKFVKGITQESVRSGSKTFYAYATPSFMSKHIVNLNDLYNNPESDKWINDPFFTNAPLYKKLKEGKVSLSYSVLDKLNEEGRQGKEYTELSPRGYLSTIIHSWYNNGVNQGRYPTSVLADGSRMVLLSLPKHSSNVNSKEVRESLYSIAQQEFTRISSESKEEMPYQKDKKTKEPLSGRFNLGVADNSLNNMLKEVGISEMMNLENKDAVIDTMIADIEEQYELFVSELIENNLIEDGFNIKENALDSRLGKGETLDKNLKHFFFDSLINQSQIITMFATDPALYAGKEDFFKRVKQIYSPGTYLDVDNVFKGKLAEGMSEIIPDKYATAYVKDSEKPYAQIEEFKTALINSGVSEKNANKIADSYKEVNEADAQAYIDPVRYRDIMIGLDRWSQQHEDAMPALLNGTATPGQIRLVMQPIKPFYYNQEVFNSNVIGVQNKNAEILVLPQFAKGEVSEDGNSLQSVMEKMGYTFDGDKISYDKRNRIADSIQYESTVKVGKHESRVVDNVDSINKKSVTYLDNSAYRLQQETPEHHLDSKSLIGTQPRKLGVADLDVASEYDITDENGDKLNGLQVVSEFNEILAEDIKESFNDLLADLGVSFDEEGNMDVDESSTKKVLSIIRKEFESRGLSDEHLKAIQFDEKTGKSRLPLYHPLVLNRVEAVLNSLFKNNVTRRKIKGGAFINMSSVGLSNDLKVVFNESNDSISHFEAILPYTSKQWVNKEGFLDESKIPNELREALLYRIPNEDKYSMFPIKVVRFSPQEMGGVVLLPKAVTQIAGLDFDVDKVFAMLYEFTKTKDGKFKKIQYTDSVSKYDYLKRTPEAKEIFAKNSPEIKELQEDMENLGELIDLYEAGEYEAFNKYAGEQATYDSIFDEYEALEEEIINKKIESKAEVEALMSDEQYSVIPQFQRVSKKARDNRKIDLLLAVLKNKNTLEAQLNGGNYEKIIKASEKVGIEPLGGISSPLTLMKMHQRNMAGRGLIGPFAHHNTNHAQVQNDEVGFVHPVKVKDKNTNNEFENRAMLNNISVNGVRISKEIASGLAAVVDNAKDPRAEAVNINNFTIEEINTLVRLGVDMYDVLMLTSQPIIKKLSKAYFNNGADSRAEELAIKEVSNLIGLEEVSYRTVVSPVFNFKALEGTVTSDDLFTDTQRDVLKNFLILKRGQAKELARFTYSFALDSGAGPTIAHNNKKISDMASVIKSDGINIGNYMNSPQSKSVGALFTYGFNNANIVINTVGNLPYSKQAFTSLDSYVTSMFPRTSSISVEEYNKMYANSIDYIASGHEFFNISNEEQLDLIKTLPDTLTKVKDTHSDKYLILNHLQRYEIDDSTLGGELRDAIRFVGTTGLTKPALDDVRRSWTAMMSDNSPAYEGATEDNTVAKFAKDLFKYSFMRNGLKLGPNSFGHLATVDMYESLNNFNEYLDLSMSDKAIKPEYLGTKFLHQYIRNNYKTLSFVPSVESKDVKFNSETSIPANKESNINPLVGKVVSFGIYELPSYIKVIDDAGTESLFMLDATNKYYHKINGLGLTNEYQQYNLKEPLIGSIFEDELTTTIPTKEGNYSTDVESSQINIFNEGEFTQDSEQDGSQNNDNENSETEC